MPSALQTKVRRTYTSELNEEIQAADVFYSERGSNEKTKTDRPYNGRPTPSDFEYCGVAEFEGVHQCREVKNLGQICNQFTPRDADPQPRSCNTCTNNRRVSPQVLQTLEQYLRQFEEGRELWDRKISPAHEIMVDSEYQECVGSIGFLPSKPACLPYCEALSRVDRTTGTSIYLVGPVVNSAERCGHWSARTEPEFATDNWLNTFLVRQDSLNDVVKLLDSRDERLQDLVLQNFFDHAWSVESAFEDVADRASQDQSYRSRLAAALAGAHADFVEFSLVTLGHNHDFIRSIGSDWFRVVSTLVTRRSQENVTLSRAAKPTVEAFTRSQDFADEYQLLKQQVHGTKTPSDEGAHEQDQRGCRR